MIWIHFRSTTTTTILKFEWPTTNDRGGVIPAQPPGDEVRQSVISTPGLSMLRTAIPDAARDRSLAGSNRNLSRQESKKDGCSHGHDCKFRGGTASRLHLCPRGKQNFYSSFSSPAQKELEQQTTGQVVKTRKRILCDIHDKWVLVH